MSLNHSTSDKSFHLVSILSILLLAIAYSTHLTVLEIDPRLDEVRRGLVTVEMMISGNYLVPTINGELFLNKPPLYNWLLALSYKTFGINEFALRMPVILAIFLFGWAIYFFSAKFIAEKAALIAALLFMTNGRILIYDSLMGLIDILYSSIVYVSFMLIYYYGKKEKWFQLFLYTYLLVVVGYLMKGLPSLVYQGFALLVFFLMEKRFRLLFHRAHFIGFGIMVLLLGTYYFAYFSRADLDPAALFTRIVTESTDRTFVKSDGWMFVTHFLTYPLVFAYHYAPWTLLGLLLIRKSWISRLRQNPFIWYNSLLFFACFFIYWLSPNIIARYMFMLLPLFFTVVSYYYVEVSHAGEKLKQAIHLILIGVIAIAGLGCLSLPFLSFTNHLPGVGWHAVLVSAMLLACAYLAIRFPALRLSFIIMGIICTRFGFNWFVVEQRGRFSVEQRMEAEKVMAIAGDRPISYEKGADLGNPDGLSFNISVKQNRIVPIAEQIKRGHVYVTDSVSMSKRPHQVLYHWASEFQPNHYLVSYDAEVQAEQNE